MLTPSFAGLRTSAPSNVTFDGAGRIYFTVDERPPFLASYHHNANDDAGEQQAAIGVYRIDPDGLIVQVLRRPHLHRPNGIALSPDDRALYVIENDISAGGTRQLLAFALSAAGQATKRRVLKDFYQGRSGDGLSVDCEGHIYVAAGLNALRGIAETLDTRAGIHVFTPDGRPIRFIPILEDSVTNLTFAGEDMRTVYVTVGKTLFTFVNDVPGLSR